jgi:thiol:disulfide interchange protein DsbD
VPRFLFGIVFITIGLHLTPALFKHGPEGERNRPSGLIYAWVDSFLLPEPSEGHGGLTWTADLRQAVEKARAEKKLVFVDFTGVTCVNCKLNERTVFGKPEFRELFEPYKRVQLYTDTVPEEFYPQSQRSRLTLAQRDADALANLAFQKAVFGTEQLPLYAILRPLPAGGDGPPKVQIVGVYAEGKINDEAAFAAFLSEPQQAKK